MTIKQRGRPKSPFGTKVVRISVAISEQNKNWLIQESFRLKVPFSEVVRRALYQAQSLS